MAQSSPGDIPNAECLLRADAVAFLDPLTPQQAKSEAGLQGQAVWGCWGRKNTGPSDQTSTIHSLMVTQRHASGGFVLISTKR